MDILKNLADLIKVKTIVTFMVMLVYVVMALRGDIQPDTVQNVTFMVLAFYFGTQYEKAATIKAQTKDDTEATAE